MINGAQLFDEDVLVAWFIVYDCDPDKVYSFDDYDKVIASVESSMRGYVGDDEKYDEEFQRVLNNLRSKKDAPLIPMRLDNLTIFIYRWEMDKTHVLHKLLCECYDKVDGDLRQKITCAFDV